MISTIFLTKYPKPLSVEYLLHLSISISIPRILGHLMPCSSSIALIGCGPSGMFFLHALALRRKALEKEGDSEAIASLPVVTCFERESLPGGVWRSNRNNDTESTNMYEALWTNGPHTTMEFPDYSLYEHFGCPLPIYLPRKLVLDYILARVSRENSNIFDTVLFNTSVKSIRYDEELQKFIVETIDNKTTLTSVTHFDKCIWAAGQNRKPKIPQSISKTLVEGGYKGKIMHSSQTGTDFDTDVRGKKILLIGDNYSAEDLTLQAIKLGVDQVTICSRLGKGVAYMTGSWPMDKVDVEYGYVPSGVTNHGQGIVLTQSIFDFTQEKFIKTGEKQILDRVDTIIFCTGYSKVYEMLDTLLKPNQEMRHFSDIDIPTGWEMPDNFLSSEFGCIPVGKIISSGFIHFDLYRGMLISNPNMMFLLERTDFPLLDLDIQTWVLLAHITGCLPIPSQEQMKLFNKKQFFNHLEDPIHRFNCDGNYNKCWNTVDDEHWSCNMCDVKMNVMMKKYYELQFKVLSRDMIDSKYPLVIGTYDELNEKGDALVRSNMDCSYARYALDEKSPDASWRTFRDCDPSQCCSVITGKTATQLQRHWLDLVGDNYEL